MQKRKYNETIVKQYQMQGSCCVYCKQPALYEDITRDHFAPKRFGNTLVNNKVFACYDCNQAKDDLTIAEFYEQTMNELNRLLKQIAISDFHCPSSLAKKLEYLKSRRQTILEIINNGGKPKFLFT